MKQTIHILFVIIILAFSGCKKDDVKVQSFNIISESVEKHATSITITLNYTYPSVIKTVDGYISDNSNMDNATNAQGEINGKTIKLKFNDLQANTTYYYYYEYSNGIDNLTKSDIKTIITNDYGLPTVTTNDVTDITATSAICGGEVTDNGEAEIIARGVCYGLNENPTIDGNHTIDSIGIGSFSSILVDLSTNTTYYVRAYATNQKGTSYGEQKSFITTDGLPTVTTMEVTDITATTATCGGTVVDDGGFAVTARGVCYSTNPNPTIDNSHTNDGAGSGSFTSHLSDLSSYTTYYVRAYATNCNGTIYAEQKSFVTTDHTGSGAGLFSVSSSKLVCFSKGNLQYQASTRTWRFAENQYTYIGADNSNISSSYSGWIDLFGWGTSGFSHGAVCYQPYSTSQDYINYYAYGQATFNLYDQTGKADWGYNRISNGGNTDNMWRTLTSDEWLYLFTTRITTSGIRFAMARINGINGVIILPDGWSNSYYTLNSTNNANAMFSTNVITENTWVYYLESYGAIFLPAAGDRFGTYVDYVNSIGFYWSSSVNSYDHANIVIFAEDGISAEGVGHRHAGISVRLVCDIE